MEAFKQNEMIRADELTGPADLYRGLLTLKNGFADGVGSLGCYVIRKADAKRAGIPWTFVVDSCAVLGLRIDNRAGRYGHMISR